MQHSREKRYGLLRGCLLGASITLLALGPNSAAEAQIAKDDISVDLGSGVFTELLPFDVKFDVVGEVGAEITRVELGYLPSCVVEEHDLKLEQIWADSAQEFEHSPNDGKRLCPRVYYFNTYDMKTGEDAKYIVRRSNWSKTGNTTFRLEAGPLHAGVDYTFFFRQYMPLLKVLEGAGVDRDKVFSDFSQALLKEIKSGALTTPNEGEVDALVCRLEATLANRLGKREDEIEIKFPARTALLRNQNLLKDIAKFSFEVDDGLDAQVETLAIGLQKICDVPNRPCPTEKLREAIEKLLPVEGTETELSERTIDLLQTPLNSARFQAMTALEAAKIIHDVLGKPGLLDDLFKGSQVRENGSFVVSNPRFKNSEFIAMMRDLVAMLTSPYLRAKDGSRLITLEGVPGLKENPLVDLRNRLDALLANLEQRSDAIESPQRQKLLARFNAALRQAAANIDVVITGRGVDNQAADRDIYVSWEVGIGYASQISTSFPYTGATIYTVPVNNKAPLSTFRGRDRFTKTVGFLVGFTEKIETDETTGVQDLTGSGSVLLGATWRPNRTLRLSVGGLLYKKTNPSPLVTEEDDDFTPFVSLSIDMRATLQTLTNRILRKN